MGFGTGRDSLWFARTGRRVRGLDFAESAVAHGRAEAAERDLPCEFDLLDLYDDQAVTRAATSLTATPGPRAVYGRFLVHSLEDAGRANLVRLAADVLRNGGGELFLEFRTGKDLGQEHLFGDDHFRQFIDPMVVELEIEDLGGAVTYREEGCGLAVYRTEDPHVARIVAHFPAGARR
ncbi:class I SAM-dependent methyltransferase [Nocardioides caricicola]|uniref:class I SAM-dependent methyltransferase n=1 Tax=Nocardioides caricicola TaxID=634770 RepID=UPI0031EDD5EC